MRIPMTAGLVVIAWLGAAPATIAADRLAVLKPVPPQLTPVPRLQPAACRVRQCNCHPECVIYEGDRCVRSVRTCDVCTDCDD